MLINCTPQLSDPTSSMPHRFGTHIKCTIIQLLESVQKFALKICSKHCNVGYSALLDMVHVPSLENRRIYLKLCTSL